MGEFLKSDSFRRIVAALVGVALPVVNAKLGLNIPSEQVVGALVVVGGYIAQSVANDMHARRAAVEAATNVKTVEEAVAHLKSAGLLGAELKKEGGA